MKWRHLIPVVLASLSGYSVAVGAGLALMKIEQGARPAAMGGAFVGVPADVASSMYNPAGAVDINRIGFLCHESILALVYPRRDTFRRGR